MPISSANDTTPIGRGGVWASRLEYRYGVVLLLLVTTFTFLTAAPAGAWARPITVVLQGTTLWAALSASGSPVRLRRLALTFTGLGLLTALATLNDGARVTYGLLSILNALFLGIAPVAIARSVVRRRTIDVSTVMAALCVYVLLGMLWAFVYTAAGTLGGRPFFAQQTGAATSADYLYFSFVTQTTVGYGDLTAAGNLGRAFAVLEALIGQIYLVTIVAVVVANLSPRRRATGD